MNTETNKTLLSSEDKLKSVGTIQDRLNALMLRAGNPNAFAKQTGLSVSGLKRYLNGGEPTASKIIQIAEATGVSPGWLLTGHHDPVGSASPLPSDDSGLSQNINELSSSDKGVQTRLRELMGTETESSFALKCHIPLSTMRKYLNGSTPSLDNALQIAQLNDVSLEWLASGEEVKANKKVDTETLESEFALIPGYSVQVSAGHGCLTKRDEKPTRYLAFRRKWLKWKRFDEKDLTVIWAKGDSMHPTISDNDTLVVHLGRKEPKDGYIYVFRNGDELFVKRFQDMLGSWRLISDNPLYAAMDIQKHDQHQFEVLGQVVHLAKDIAD